MQACNAILVVKCNYLVELYVMMTFYLYPHSIWKNYNGWVVVSINTII